MKNNSNNQKPNFNDNFNHSVIEITNNNNFSNSANEIWYQ